MPEKKKKRASLSSFTIILSILVGLAIVTVIMGAMGVEGVQGATLSDVLTAPVKGFQGAMGVCIFVMVLGGFLGIVTETGALDAGIAALVHKLKGNELMLIDLLCEKDDSVFQKVEKAIQNEKFTELVRAVLTEREFKIITLRYGLKGGRCHPQREVALLMRISRSYVSRIEKKAVEKLKAAVKKEDFYL